MLMCSCAARGQNFSGQLELAFFMHRGIDIRYLTDDWTKDYRDLLIGNTGTVLYQTNNYTNTTPALERVTVTYRTQTIPVRDPFLCR